MSEKQLLPAVVTPMKLVVTADVALAELEKLRDVVKLYLKEGTDFGKHPGSGNKDVLFKPGAEKMLDVYNFYGEPEITQRLEDWDRGLFDYEFKTTIRRRDDGLIFGIGYGSCNSFESKFRYRNGERKCPACGVAAIIKGKAEFGGGWVCWKKKKDTPGCGESYSDNDPLITDQEVGKIENTNLADVKNTVLKMAEKRSFIGATLRATRSSELFTQDLDDYDYSQAAILDVTPISVSTEKKQDEATSSTVSNAEKSPKTERATASTATNKPAQKTTTQEATGPSTTTQSADSASSSTEMPGQEQKDQMVAVAKSNGFEGPDIGSILKTLFNVTASNMDTDFTWKVFEQAVKWFQTHKKPDLLKGTKVTKDNIAQCAEVQS